jgi:hypothetical protein
MLRNQRYKTKKEIPENLENHLDIDIFNTTPVTTDNHSNLNNRQNDNHDSDDIYPKIPPDLLSTMNLYKYKYSSDSSQKY